MLGYASLPAEGATSCSHLEAQQGTRYLDRALARARFEHILAYCVFARRLTACLHGINLPAADCSFFMFARDKVACCSLQYFACLHGIKWPAAYCGMYCGQCVNSPFLARSMVPNQLRMGTQRICAFHAKSMQEKFLARTALAIGHAR